MTSRFMSFLKILGPRSATTAVHPHSWGAVSVWRRLFAQPKEEERDFRGILCDIFGISGVEKIRPIARTDYGALVREYALDGHRANLGQQLRCSVNVPLAFPMHGSNEARTTRAYQQVHSPDLDIPDGDDYLTRAQ